VKAIKMIPNLIPDDICGDPAVETHSSWLRSLLEYQAESLKERTKGSVKALIASWLIPDGSIRLDFELYPNKVNFKVSAFSLISPFKGWPTLVETPTRRFHAVDRENLIAHLTTIFHSEEFLHTVKRVRQITLEHGLCVREPIDIDDRSI
jgi:hypothetical protein